MTSLWLARDAEAGAHTSDEWTQRREVYDTVVVGAGLTGVVTALLLARSGQRVAILEARDIGAVTTGNTTAKVSLLQGTALSQISRRHSRPVVQAYVDGNLGAQRWIAEFCKHNEVETETADAYTYAVSGESVASVEAEHRSCRAAGLPTRTVTDTELPYPVASAVVLPNQIQFDPMPMLRAAVRELRASDGEVFTGIRAVSASTDSGGCTVETESGSVRGAHVVLATGMPILDRGGFFARLEPERSYACAFEVAETPPSGMYLSVDSPTRSIRTAPAASPHGTSSSGNDRRLLLVGGNGHVVGRHKGSTRAAVADLVAWTQRHFPGAKPVARWSAQDYSTLDSLPYVGPLLPTTDRLWVATGYGKWGMTNAVTAAHLLSTRITGERDPEIEAWAPGYSAWSPSQLFDVPSAVKLNAGVGINLARGWWSAETSSDSSTAPGEGEGRVARDCGLPVGISTIDGRTQRVSAVCPHLGGVLRWNDEEASWDCPLHGSRFAADGTRLEGPATSDLHRR
ncbi:FAD-dependent oxidoreductase [Rhodococcus sp. DT1]|uniref:FAD-dependent oxidoreductase n=1 Tax=Rhodococcus sp. DT1 TaxID=3416544 RepID=UPI003CF3A337